MILINTAIQLAFVHHGPLTFNRSRQGESLYEKD